MYQISYTSQAAEPFTHEQLVEMLQAFRANNDKLGVTGMLIYKTGTFMQIIEGEPEVISALYARIQADPRHTDVRTLFEHIIPARVFTGWSMAFCNTERLGDTQRKQIEPYIEFKPWGIMGQDTSRLTNLRRDFFQTD